MDKVSKVQEWRKMPCYAHFSPILRHIWPHGICCGVHDIDPPLGGRDLKKREPWEESQLTKQQLLRDSQQLWVFYSENLTRFFFCGKNGDQNGDQWHGIPNVVKALADGGQPPQLPDPSRPSREAERNRNT